MTWAVRAALDSLTDIDGIDAARVALALSMAGLVDGGSVPAARELRAALTDLDVIVSEDFGVFLASVRTPGLPGAGNGA